MLFLGRRGEHRTDDRFHFYEPDRIENLCQPLAVAVSDSAVPLVYVTGDVEPFVHGHSGELRLLVVHRLSEQ